MAQVSDYTSLIPSANASKPNFMAVVAMAVQPFVDFINVCENLVPGNFTLSTAVGAQLDIVGLWVGISRWWAIELENWFEWGSPPTGQGWGQGVWWEPWQPSVGTSALDDTTYRLLIQAKIAWNGWDGTTPTFYSILANLFAGAASVAITDNLNSSISVAATGSANMNQSIKQLASNALLPFVPMGITVTYSFS